MIRLPRNFFANLSPIQYREYLKLLPKLKDEKTIAYTWLTFTLAALSFFGIFAINPTLSTITELNKKLADMQFVYQKYITKAQNLSTLQDAYRSLSLDLPVVVDAMPQKPEIPKLVAQMNALLSRSNLQATSLNTMGVEITPERQLSNNDASSFAFTLQASGTYDDILSFVQSVTHADRLITIETISISKDAKKNVLFLDLRGRGYFKP
jgi:Tfp pilus assembly protein PilO